MKRSRGKTGRCLNEPVESELKDVDSEHGFAAVAEVLFFVFLGHGDLVLLVPRLFLLQFLCFLRSRNVLGDVGWSVIKKKFVKLADRRKGALAC